MTGLYPFDTNINGDSSFQRRPAGGVIIAQFALFKVSNDLFLSLDSGDCAVLILLDLSAAFDTVDHNILIDRLQCGVGVELVLILPHQ